MIQVQYSYKMLCYVLLEVRTPLTEWKTVFILTRALMLVVQVKPNLKNYYFRNQ